MNKQAQIKHLKPSKRMPSGRKEDAIRILQVTDTHLYADPAGCLLGLNTLDTLDEVLQHASQTVMPVDLVAATGDLVHDASVEGYALLRSRLDVLGVPVYCLPGNHDVAQVMRECLHSGRVNWRPCAIHGNWCFIFLDSTIDDEDGGHLAEEQLAILSSCLQTYASKHTLVFLHHHPIPVGSAWMDTMALDNPKPFFELLDRNPQVRGVLWGHIHQEFEAERNGVQLLGSPSTCIQFSPGRDGFGVDILPPGYRWLELLPDGTILTGIERLAGYPSEIDLRSAGY